jgi:hypothetical protein
MKKKNVQKASIKKNVQRVDQFEFWGEWILDLFLHLLGEFFNKTRSLNSELWSKQT